MRRTRIVARARGFTLIEVAVATAIVGIAVSALMLSVGSGTRVNDNAQKLTQAAFLAGEIREWTSNLPFSDPDVGQQGNPPGPDGSDPQVFVDDLDDLMNVTYSPPRNGSGTAITDMVGWSQKIILTWRDPANLSATVTDGASDFINVEVHISYNGREYLVTNYLVARRS